MNTDIHQLSDKLYTWLLTVGPRVLVGILILVMGQWVLKMLKKWLTRLLHKKDLDASLRPFLFSLIVTVFQVLLVLTVMQILGIQMTVFAALIGGIGVAVGLALSGTLQNFTSGILILILKPYMVGDNIIAQTQEGTVSSIQLFYTVVTTFDNKTVIIPNSKLSNEVIINLSREGTRRLDIELKFNYSFSIDQIKSIIQQSLNNSKDIVPEPKSRIGIIALENDGFKVAVHVWVNAHGFIDLRLTLQERIVNDLKTAGIKLPGM
jgi:small conductance mechanosensitive channel